MHGSIEDRCLGFLESGALEDTMQNILWFYLNPDDDRWGLLVQWLPASVVLLSWALCVNLQTRNVATNDQELNTALGQGIPPLFFSPTVPTTCPLTLHSSLSSTLSSHLFTLSALASSCSWTSNGWGTWRNPRNFLGLPEGEGTRRGSQVDGHVGDHQPWGQAGRLC